MLCIHVLLAPSEYAWSVGECVWVKYVEYFNFGLNDKKNDIHNMEYHDYGR